MRTTSLRPRLLAGMLATAGMLGACSAAGPDPASAPGTPGSSVETAAASPTPTPTQEPVTVTVVGSGDILPHQPVVRNANRNAGEVAGAYDFAPMFAEVAPLIKEADVAICHLETPLSADNSNLGRPGTLIFNSPREVATGLRSSGFDGCDFASNHSWDLGLDGLAATIDVVEEAGLAYAGPQAEEPRAREAAIHEVDDVGIAHLAYTYSLLNNWGPNTEVPPEAPWTGKAMWPVVLAEGIIMDAGRARDDGADLVVVSMHWGEEYVATPTQDQREVARELLESGTVDLILGTHVHVIQPCETINGRTVFYGLGNFLSNQSPDTTAGRLSPTTQEGMVARATFTIDGDGTVTSTVDYQPTRVNLDGHVIELATPDVYPQTHARTVATLASLGDGVCDATPR
ncbi:MAG: CapA family protein [Intrasporangiaceae bacterium]|nr:CapA family protein [Intrasporangiaceae bacterium]